MLQGEKRGRWEKVNGCQAEPLLPKEKERTGGRISAGEKREIYQYFQGKKRKDPVFLAEKKKKEKKLEGAERRTANWGKEGCFNHDLQKGYSSAEG